jgi:hypothetical protein
MSPRSAMRPPVPPYGGRTTHRQLVGRSAVRERRADRLRVSAPAIFASTCGGRSRRGSAQAQRTTAYELALLAGCVGAAGQTTSRSATTTAAQRYCAEPCTERVQAREGTVQTYRAEVACRDRVRTSGTDLWYRRALRAARRQCQSARRQARRARLRHRPTRAPGC